MRDFNRFDLNMWWTVFFDMLDRGISNLIILKNKLSSLCEVE